MIEVNFGEDLGCVALWMGIYKMGFSSGCDGDIRQTHINNSIKRAKNHHFSLRFIYLEYPLLH